jgi:hypothetical protein
MLRVLPCVAVLTMLFCSAQSSAQIIYAPVKYQHGEQNKFYYGGSDPRVLAYADGPSGGAGRWGRVHGFDFVSGNVDTHREVSYEPERVYTDAVPFQNARIYGFTANDARNEAYANVPTYFRKADLIDAAIPTPGAWIVPAHGLPAPRIYYPGAERLFAPSSAPATMPRPLMIIPKKNLQRAAEPAKKFAAAR